MKLFLKLCKLKTQTNNPRMTQEGAIFTPWALSHSEDELLFNLFVKCNFMEVDVVMFLQGFNRNAH